MLRKIVATVVTVLLAATIAAPAQATGNNTVTEWHTWKIPVDCPKDLDGKGSAQGKGWPDCSPTPPFPQSHVGKGQLVPPCGVWYQQDQYTGTRKQIDDVVKDKKLTYSNGKPEDHAIVKAWKFVYGGDCIPPQPKDKVEKTEWQEQVFKCGDTKVTSTREVTTTSYKLKNGEWVLDTKNSKTVTETKERDVTKAEKESCKPPKPEALTGKVKLPTTYECVVPKDGTKTVTEWAKDWTQDYTWDKKKDKWVLGDKVWGEPYVTKTTTVDDTNCIPVKPQGLNGEVKLPSTYECVVPKNGTKTVTEWAKKWTQDYTWVTQARAWVLGEKVWGEPFITSTKTIDDKNCIPHKPKGLKGDVKLPPTYECVVPNNGTKTVTEWAKKWTQDYTWDTQARAWVLGEKVWGEPFITKTKVVDDKDCIPSKPEGLKGEVKLPPTYECVFPKDGTKTVTEWSKKWTQDYTWDKWKKKWVLGDKVWGQPYITNTTVVDDKHCIPHKPKGLKGEDPLDPTFECVDPLDGTATKTSYAQKWTQDYTWDKDQRVWVLGEKVYGEPFVTGTETVDDETCIPEPPAARGSDPVDPTYECVVPANGKATLTSYARDWTQVAEWGGPILKWILAEKVYGEPYITTTDVVDDPECDPIEPTLTATLVPQCIQNVPFVNYEVTLTDPDGQSTNTDDVSFTYLNTSGNGEPNAVITASGSTPGAEAGTFHWSGTFLWPGASYTGSLPGELTGTGWPGWALVEDEWIETGDDNHGWTLGGVDVNVAVNPETQVNGVVYPEAAFPCTPITEISDELPAPPAAPVTADAQYAG